MTKEELKVLKDWMPELELMARYNDNSIDYQRYSALDMAIKALEQQSTLDTRQRERQLEMEYQHGYDKGWEEGRKALEQQPCEDMRDATEEERKSTKDYIDSISKPTGLQFDDCISREKAIKQCGFGMTSLLIADCLRRLPPVIPQRPKGKWILIHPLQEDDDGAYICSNCEHGDWDCDTNYKYCPFCGADMRESEDKE